MVHYKNPLLVLGCVPEWQGKILLCRRAIEPRLGFWTVPAGFMENGETMQAAAARDSPLGESAAAGGRQCEVATRPAFFRFAGPFDRGRSLGVQ